MDGPDDRAYAKMQETFDIVLPDLKPWKARGSGDQAAVDQEARPLATMPEGEDWAR